MDPLGTPQLLRPSLNITEGQASSRGANLIPHQRSPLSQCQAISLAICLCYDPPTHLKSLFPKVPTCIFNWKHNPTVTQNGCISHGSCNTLKLSQKSCPVATAFGQGLIQSRSKVIKLYLCLQGRGKLFITCALGQEPTPGGGSLQLLEEGEDWMVPSNAESEFVNWIAWHEKKQWATSARVTHH